LPPIALPSQLPLRPLGATAVAAATGAALLASGIAAQVVATLVVIGFSPDRSELINALILAGLGVALAALVFDRTWSGVLGGAIGFVLGYHRTFDGETRAALSSSGAGGTFDPLGWLLSLATLAVTVIVVGWSVATLFRIARRHLVAAVHDLREFRHDPRRGRLLRPAGVLGVTLALAVALPVLGDMLNYEPDVHMRQGAAAADALTGGAAMSLPPDLPSLPPSDLLTGGILGPSASPGASGATGSIVSTSRPWLAWRPTGAGTTTSLVVPAPWGPSGATDPLGIYLPPGYSASSTRHYPVLYEVPRSLAHWQTAMYIKSALDSLIDAGSIPPLIMVFAVENGGPYPDSECADSIDHREWFATWMANTVVPTIDSTYRTIRTAAARGVVGFSQGGFCSAMLASRFPTVFGTGIVFSGYFVAGIHSGETPNAGIPFGGDAAYEATFSPIQLCQRMAAAIREHLFFELSAAPTEPFFGPQYQAFARVLAGAGIPQALFPTPLGHAWAAVRTQFPTVLATWGERMAALNVFSA
jgi:enterochelin esterase-like enzyme